MKNRIVAGVLALLMIAGISAAAVTSVFSADSEINIESTDDFLEFSRMCTLDSNSQGLKVNLMCDLDFSGKEFEQVPTFGGVFNGNGYTISGVKIEEKGSYVGVFRYIREGGKVSDLNVKGEIVPGGSRSFAGGIVGENSGSVERCSFDGTVKGENVMGGIAGYNTGSGRIVSCNVYGSVTGENSTGGIVGKNDGFIGRCTNNAAVNTVFEEKKKTMSDIDTDAEAIVENYKNEEEENEEESVLGHIDTGGVAGYTSGIIQGCDNCGNVGYKHVGYNVGGIAGRQSGYILGCKNYALVQGRKDVGGIVGQAEPYILLNSSESKLSSIRDEVDVLNTMVNNFIDDTDDIGDDAEKYLDGISEYVKSARDSANELSEYGADFIDDNLSEINAQAAILSNTLDKLSPVFESLENSSEDIENALTKIADTLDETDFDTPNAENQIDDIVSALKRISKSEKSIKEARKRMRQAEKNLADAIVVSDTELVESAMKELTASVGSISSAVGEIEEAVGNIEDIINSSSDDIGDLKSDMTEISSNIGVIRENLGVLNEALSSIFSVSNILSSSTKLDISKVKAAASNIKSAAEYMADAMIYITKGIGELGDGIKETSDVLSDYFDEMDDELERMTEGLSDGLKSLSYASEDISDALGDMKDIFEELSEEEPLEFVKLGDEFRSSGENLFDSLSGMSTELDGLKDVLTGGRSRMSVDLSNLSEQLNLIMSLIVGEVEDLENGVRELSDIIVDVSDEEIENAKQGKVEECENCGTVEADRNAGGVVGALAIEYSKDPEDDLEKPSMLNFTYRSRAIIQKCINDGFVTGKKDCVGGIVGREDIGTVYGCENYGNVESSNGNYVGGAVGKSESAVRKSYSKAACLGKRYVGGIAGKGKSVTQCYAIASVDGDENIGAVLGGADDREAVFNNYYVDGGVGAIDKISYENRAEPIEYERLANMDNIPTKFVSFTVKFMADGNLAAESEIKYGESVSRIEYPEVPEKDGCFGRWIEPDFETVTGDIVIECEYKPYIKLLSSNEKNESGKLALALAEGNFTDAASLIINKSDENPPNASGGGAVVYDVELTDEKVLPTDDVTFRFLNEDKGKVTAWILENGRWEKVKVHNRGKYVVIRDVNAVSTVCLKYENRSLNFLLITIIALLTAGAVFVVIRKCKLSKK